MIDEKFALDAIREKIKDSSQIIPVGHHELERHLVYKVERKGKSPVIFKVFLKKNRWNREIATLRYLEDKGLKVAKLIDYGTLEDGTQWSCVEYFDGKVFSDISDMSRENRMDVYRQMGEEIAKMHNTSNFEYFGNWSERLESIDRCKSYQELFFKRVEVVRKNVEQSDIPEKDILLEGIEKLKSQKQLLEGVKAPVLCHNDFDERNVLLKNHGPYWSLGIIIDFEQSLPWDRDYDIAYLYKRLKEKDEHYAKALVDGYGRFSKIGESFYQKIDFYMLFIGICICSWARDLAPAYFAEGLEMVVENLGIKIRK